MAKSSTNFCKLLNTNLNTVLSFTKKSIKITSYDIIAGILEINVELHKWYTRCTVRRKHGKIFPAIRSQLTAAASARSKLAFPRGGRSATQRTQAASPDTALCLIVSPIHSHRILCAHSSHCFPRDESRVNFRLQEWTLFLPRRDTKSA